MGERADMPDEAAIHAYAEEVEGVFPVIRGLLGGRPPQVQGAILAELQALWLCGHTIVGDPEATAALREDLLDKQLRYVRRLVELDDAARKANG